MKYFLVLSLFQLSLYASEIQLPINVIQIAQINTSKKQIVLKASQDLQVGQELIVTNHESKQCSIAVIQKINEIVVADISKCEIMSTITTKDKVETYLAELPVKSKEPVIPTKALPEVAMPEQNLSKYKKSVEIMLLNISGISQTLESKLVQNGEPLLKLKDNDIKINSIPLVFKIELENDSNGFISNLDFKEQSGDLTLYSKVNEVKVGGGLDIKYSKKTATTSSIGTTVSDTETSTRTISPYGFIKNNLTTNEQVKIDVWAKAGGGFIDSTNRSTTTTTSGFSELTYTIFYINPGIDFFFKAGKNLQVGLGADVGFGGLSGTLKSGSTERDGNGTVFYYNLDLLKLKYEF